MFTHAFEYIKASNYAKSHHANHSSFVTKTVNINKTAAGVYTNTLAQFQINARSTIYETTDDINPLKCSGIRRLHFKVFSAIQI